MNFEFKTITEFNDYFNSEKTCYDFLENSRWNGSPACPYCGTVKKPYTVKSRGKFKDIPSYRCSERACDLPFTVRTGGIFEGSQVELRKWYLAIYELSTDKNGISSVELATRIGVSQKTAWLMNHKLRNLLGNDNTPLSGTVEIDECFVGGKSINKHKNKITKGVWSNQALSDSIPVLGMVQRNGDVIAKVLKSRKKNNMLPLIYQNVEAGATIHTDEFSAYNDLQNDYNHCTIEHGAKEYVKGLCHTNTIENFWSQLKRGITGTYRAVSVKHLQRYCNEFSTRQNLKSSGNINIFNILVNMTDTNRIRYQQLTAQ